MKKTAPDSAQVLASLANCFMDTNPAAVKALKQLFNQMDPRTTQVYITNLKKLLTEYPLFNLRITEKAYFQVMTALNEVMKDGLYKARNDE